MEKKLRGYTYTNTCTWVVVRHSFFFFQRNVLMNAQPMTFFAKIVSIQSCDFSFMNINENIKMKKKEKKNANDLHLD